MPDWLAKKIVAYWSLCKAQGMSDRTISEKLEEKFHDDFVQAGLVEENA
jgi:hypothetical protein